MYLRFSRLVACAFVVGSLTGCSGDFFPSFHSTNLVQHHIQGDRLPVRAVINTVKCDLARFFKNAKDAKHEKLLDETKSASVKLSLKISTTGGVNYKQLDVSNLLFWVGGSDSNGRTSVATPWPGFLYRMTGGVSADIDFAMKQDGAYFDDRKTLTKVRTLKQKMEKKEKELAKARKKKPTKLEKKRTNLEKEPAELEKELTELVKALTDLKEDRKALKEICLKENKLQLGRKQEFVNSRSPLSLNTLGLDEWLTKVFEQMADAQVGSNRLVQLNTMSLSTSFQLYAKFSAGTAEVIRFVPVRETPIGTYEFDRTHTIKIVLQGKCPKCKSK